MIDSIFEEERTEKAGANGVVLSVEGVSKKFCRDLKQSLWYGMRDITSELLRQDREAQLRPGEFWALDNVSFQLRQGEALGLVGPNGSGKTTLLRIISGLIKPDRGAVEIKGRIAPLIALGAGFNPILTGRENIYANMSILGLSKQQIDERFDAVVEFAEIGEAIDAPVQSYSSGMAARLGFASAIHTEPEILLIDEVLAVGDIRFRQKCFRKLYDLRQRGTSFILVSHSSQAILNVCTTAVYLLKGKLIEQGEAETIISQYEQDLFDSDVNIAKGAMFLPAKDPKDSLGIDIRAVFFRNSQEKIVETILSGELTYFCLKCKVYKPIGEVSVKLAVRELSGENELVLLLNNGFDEKLLDLSPGEQEIRLYMPYLCLNPGSYTMRIVISKDLLYTFDFVETFCFRVETDKTTTKCLFYQPREWQVVNSPTPQAGNE